MAINPTVRAGYPVLSDDSKADLLTAIEMIHAIIGGATFSTAENPESRTAIETSDVGYVFQRAMTALSAKSQAERHAAMSGVKACLDSHVSQARAARDEALAGVAALPPAMRTLLDVDAKLAKLDVTYVKVSDLLGAFPNGTTTTQAVEYLRDSCKLEIANVAAHGSKGKEPVFAVRVNLNPSAPPAKVA
jgi:hypothetical protein